MILIVGNFLKFIDIVLFSKVNILLFPTFSAKSNLRLVDLADFTLHLNINWPQFKMGTNFFTNETTKNYVFDFCKQSSIGFI